MLGVIALVITMVATHVHASDFWDEVKTPGLREQRRLTTQAAAALAAGRNIEALGLADRAIARVDGRADAHLLRAVALGSLARAQDGLTALRRAVELDSRVADAFPDLGERAALVALRADDPELAATVLGRVVARMAATPARQRLEALRGDALLTVGPPRLADALRAFRDALRLAPQDLRVRLGLALALRRNGEPDEAAEVIRGTGLARSRPDLFVQSLELPLPRAEIAARRAVGLAAIGDVEGERDAWQEAATREAWREHAERELAASRAAAGPGAAVDTRPQQVETQRRSGARRPR